MLGPAESDEEAAQGGADGHGYAHDGAEPAEGPAAFLAAEVLLDHAHALWVEQAGADALDEAGDVEGFGGGCEARGDGGDRVDAEADEVDPAAAQQVAGTSRGDEDDAEGQGVAGKDQLDVGFGRAQALLDGGQGHVDDGHADQRHEDRREDHAEDLPAARIFARGIGPRGLDRGLRGAGLRGVLLVAVLLGAQLLDALWFDAFLLELLACAFCVRVLLSHRGVRSP